MVDDGDRGDSLTAIDAIDALAQLHFPRSEGSAEWCSACGIAWPCPTRRIIDQVPESGRSDRG